MTPEDLKRLLKETRTQRTDVRELTLADRLDDEDDRLRGGLL